MSFLRGLLAADDVCGYLAIAYWRWQWNRGRLTFAMHNAEASLRDIPVAEEKRQCSAPA